ncbi:hypothetical protein SYNPS1DRAFT_22534 [Syncephalis pseudoplumigaleata]|uniref:Uncharacterized protein n=1 Tax=Syncephalis pseudoplumigaleata TaxID=1712513 RepID=A0A4P9YZW7_9FUNG|nr:hypothetical protein SYNPS1DRAFT_22534 [Syncephalis pseudoplumigaleata]|eukprot:RKP25515.1 hypothetical protein SYNPS1DRAFT_22534 [Syncephalis pseudoplumigaleata]
MFSIPFATAAAIAGPTVAAIGTIAYAFRHPDVDDVDEHGRRRSWLRSSPEELSRRRSLEHGQHVASNDVQYQHGRLQRDTTGPDLVSRARQGLEQTGEDARQAMRTAGDRLSEAGQQTIDRTREMAQSVRTTAGDAWDRTREAEAEAVNKTRSWFDWASGRGGSSEGSDEAMGQRVADTASDIAASSQGARRDFSDAASRAGDAIGDMAGAASDTVQRTASEGMNATRSKLSQMKDEVNEGYNDAKERMSNVGHAMADRAQQAADNVDSALRRTPEELGQARAGNRATVVESRELAWESGGPEGSGVRRASRRKEMDPYNESKWLRQAGVNYGHNSQHRWID